MENMMIQVTAWEPDVKASAHKGAVWPVVLQFGDELTPHTTWYLRAGQLDELIEALLAVQLRVALADAEDRRNEIKMEGGDTDAN